MGQPIMGPPLIEKCAQITPLAFLFSEINEGDDLLSSCDAACERSVVRHEIFRKEK